MRNVLCFGDSNTYGYDPKTGLRYPSDVRWTGVLQKLLGDDFKVIEEGCNGRTTVFEDPVEGWKCGLPYLRPCLNTHKPIDIVCLMLGTNDLKTYFNASAAEIADGSGKLIDVIKEFTKEKQGYVPEIILMSPPRIGEEIESSPFAHSFGRSAIERSKDFPSEYKRVAVSRNVTFFDASLYADPSKEDSLHLDEDSHRRLAKALAVQISI